MDSALSALNAGRADLGAYQNRFSSAISNVQTTSENLAASRSRIVDTDFAAETATLVAEPGAATGRYGDAGPGQCNAAKRAIPAQGLSGITV